MHARRRTTCSRSRTRRRGRTRAVIEYIRAEQPDVVIFDSSGRLAQYRAAHGVGRGGRLREFATQDAMEGLPLAPDAGAGPALGGAAAFPRRGADGVRASEAAPGRSTRGRRARCDARADRRARHARTPGPARARARPLRRHVSGRRGRLRACGGREPGVPRGRTAPRALGRRRGGRGARRTSLGRVSRMHRPSRASGWSARCQTASCSVCCATRRSLL